MATIILCLLLAALLTGGIYIYWRAKRGLEAFSLSIFGVRSLREGLGRQTDLLSETPKSVMGMTKVFLPQIEADFPEFNWAEFKQRSETMIVSVLTSIERQDTALLEEASLELKRQTVLKIEDCIRQAVRKHYQNIKVHQTEISRYVKRDGLCIITLQSAVEYIYFTDGEGESRDRTDTRLTQARYDLELVYIQDITKFKESATGMGVTCPRCGAPVTALGSKYCEYCGGAIEVVNTRVWSLNKMTENQ